MEYDPDIIKKILLAVEAKKNLIPDTISINGYEDNIITYHCLLLKDAEFIEATFEEQSNSVVTPFISRLTMKGVEFLQTARNESIWQSAKKVLKEKSLSIPISLLSELLKSLAKESLGIK